MSTRTCAVGVHGRNDVIYEEDDFRIIREAKLESIKMMSQTEPAVFKRIRQENPSIQIITRLHVDGFGAGGHPSPVSYVEHVTPHLQRLHGLCEWFQIHNEPNHVQKIEGWGATDQDAQDFNQWYLAVLAMLRERFPWARFIFPGLAMPDSADGHRTYAWLDICRPAIEASDALGVHCYWQTPSDRPSVMMEDHSGLLFKKYHEQFPDKVLHILECGNSNGQSQQGWPTDEQLYAQEYESWLQEVFNHPYVATSAFYMLSSPDSTWENQAFTWRTKDRGIKHALVERVAKMSRPALQPVTAAALDKPEVVGDIGLLPPCFTTQTLINAFNDVWGRNEFLDAMRRAGLNLDRLDKERQLIYRGTPPHRFPNISLDQRHQLLSSLVARISATPLRTVHVTESAGLNLRYRPDAEPVLALLEDGTPLKVLHEEGAWLFVAVDPNRAGYVHGDFVGEPAFISKPQTPVDGFLAADPLFQQLSMPAELPIKLSAGAGIGAKTLARIWNDYGSLLTRLAQQLQIDVKTAVAVLVVESGGRAFSEDGRMIIRFENHLFYSDWGSYHEDLFRRHYTFDPDTRWKNHTWRPQESDAFMTFHGDQTLEWQVLTFSANLDETAAKRSISMGAPQILGRNHQRIGYGTVQEMFEAFLASDRAQILGMFDFIRTDNKLLSALHREDLRTFAAGYNGPGQADRYADLIRAQIAAFSQLRVPAFGPDGVVLDPSLEEAISFLPVPRPLAVFEEEPVAVDETQELPPVAADAQAGASAVPNERIREAWETYTEEALANNNLMFKRLLRAFIIPYYMTVAMYAAMFVTGLGLFIVAVVLGLQDNAEVGVLFGGLSVVTFLTYFLGKPLRSLEENLHFITWLGLIYNTYWNRLLYMQDPETVGQDLEAATATAIEDIRSLIDKSDEMRDKRPGLR